MYQKRLVPAEKNKLELVHTLDRIYKALYINVPFVP